MDACGFALSGYDRTVSCREHGNSFVGLALSLSSGRLSLQLVDLLERASGARGGCCCLLQAAPYSKRPYLGMRVGAAAPLSLGADQCLAFG